MSTLRPKTCGPARLLVGLLIGASLLTAACGGDGRAADLEARPAAASTGTGWPVSITHKFGTATMTAPPNRVVALGDEDAVYALDITPVGISTTADQSPWLAGRVDTKATTLIDVSNGLNIEAVAALRPDVILGVNFFDMPKHYRALSAIAPTVAYEEEWGGQSWQEQALVVGRAVGREASARDQIARTEAAIADTRAASPGLAGKTFTMSYVFAPNEIVTLRSKHDPSVRLFNELGLQLAQPVTGLPQIAPDNPGGALSFEQIEKLDADLVLMLYMSDELRRSFERNPLYRRLDAVRDQRFFALDLPTVSQLRTPTVLGVPWALTQVAPALRAAAAA